MFRCWSSDRFHYVMKELLRKIFSDKNGNISSTRIVMFVSLLLINGIWAYVVIKNLSWVNPPWEANASVMGAKAIQTRFE